MSQGRLEAIWIKRGRGGPMDPAARAELVAGRGLRDNANQGGKRQVTIIEQERWAEVMGELGATMGPETRRANLMVSGLSLEQTRGQVLRIGGCRVRIYGETRPCNQMEESLPGLQEALSPHWRGGAYGEVLDDGEIAVGDPVHWEAEER